jgi:hypothetical protein
MDAPEAETRTQLIATALCKNRVDARRFATGREIRLSRRS